MTKAGHITGGMIFLLTFLFTGGIAKSLNAQDLSLGNDRVRIVQDPRVNQLVSKHIQLNLNRDGISGYRIQIFFDSGTNSKTRASSEYESFQVKYPFVNAYLTFQAPNYKVRVGDFRTRLDAQRFLNGIIAEYPNAWIISEEINLPQVEPLNTVIHE